MKIGIFKKVGSDFSNGANQQALFVGQCLANTGDHEVFYFSQKKETTVTKNGKHTILGCTDPKILQMDMVLTIGLIVIDLLPQLKKAGVRVVWYVCGHIFRVYQEDIVFDKHGYVWSNDKLQLLRDNIDELWMIPNYTAYRGFLAALFRCQTVKVAPYVWAPDIIREAVDVAAVDGRTAIANNSVPCVLIAEANLQTTKTSLVPLLICEEFSRLNPDAQFKVIVLCTPPTKAFERFVFGLDERFRSRVQFFKRLKMFDTLKQLKAQNMRVVFLSHQDDNPLNFLHLEALYLGLPLVHNAPVECYSDGTGYRYSTVQDGAKALQLALRHKGGTTAAYEAAYESASAATLHKFSPDNPANIDGYRALAGEMI